MFATHYRLFALVFLLSFASQSHGQFIVDVTTDGGDANVGDGMCATGGGDCTLRAALQEAMASGGVSDVTLPAGTYSWTLGELLIDAGEITVIGAGARTTIVDAAGSSRFMEMDAAVTSVRLQDFEFRNGLSNNNPGGAIESDASLFVVEGMVFRNCVTNGSFGGAIHNRDELEVYSCAFIDCRANGKPGGAGGGGGGGGLAAGGGISSWSGTSTIIENTSFSGCVAEGGQGGNAGFGANGGNGGNGIGSFGGGGDGGDVSTNPGALNGAVGGFGGGGGGGGIDTNGSGWINNPQAGTGGNGIALGGDGGDATENFAGPGGGGGALGGAFFLRGGSAEIRHCTMSNNSAIGGAAGVGGEPAQPGEGRGGGVGCFGGQVMMDNSILFGNQAGGPGSNEDFYHYSMVEIASNTDELSAVVGNNIIGAVAAGTVINPAVTGNQLGVDPVLLPFGDYGGPTDAFMVSPCDPLSPAIGAGAALGVTEDQRGVPRDPASPDIGSIEGPAPVVLNPIIDEVCPGETVQVSLAWPGATVTWPDGSIGDTWSAPATSDSATVTTAEGCEERIPVEVTEVPITVPDLGADTTVCPQTPVTLDAGNAGLGVIYEWSVDGAIQPFAGGQTFLMDAEGTVSVTATLGGCAETDEIQVNWLPEYPLELGPDITLCQGESIALNASNAGWTGLPPTFAWVGGPNDAEYPVSAAGTYTVEVTTSDGCVLQDDVTVVASPLTGVDLGPDQSVCPGNAIVLDPGLPTAIVTWQDGSVAPTFNVSSTGFYSVNVQLGDCEANDQVFVDVLPGFDPGLPAQETFCAGDSINVVAAFGASNYVWQDGVGGNQRWISLPGVYEVTATYGGCDFVGGVVVIEQALPPLDLGANVSLCEGESMVLDAMVPGADVTLFNDTLATSTLEVNEAGVYWAAVTANGCTARDTVQVEVSTVPVFDLMPDTTLCPGQVLTLETGLTDALVTWSSSEVGSSIAVNADGLYVATAQRGNCQYEDSTAVVVSMPINIALESQYDLCQGDELELTALQGPDVYPCTYFWDDGFVGPQRSFVRSAMQGLQVANVCDTVQHVLDIKEVVCDCQVFAPTAFTPNNDGTNDAWFPVLNCGDPFAYQLMIWDRWGRPVFTSDDPEDVWYGQVEGTPGSQTRESGNSFAIDGVYMWELIIELRKDRIPEIITHRGTLQVLR